MSDLEFFQGKYFAFGNKGFGPEANILNKYWSQLGAVRIVHLAHDHMVIRCLPPEMNQPVYQVISGSVFDDPHFYFLDYTRDAYTDSTHWGKLRNYEEIEAMNRAASVKGEIKKIAELLISFLERAIEDRIEGLSDYPFSDLVNYDEELNWKQPGEKEFTWMREAIKLLRSRLAL